MIYEGTGAEVNLDTDQCFRYRTPFQSMANSPKPTTVIQRPNTAEMAELLTVIPVAAQMLLWRYHGMPDESDLSLMIALLVDWFVKHTRFNSTNAHLMLFDLKPTLEGWLELFHDDERKHPNDNVRPTRHLIIVDDRYVAISSSGILIDGLTNQRIEKLPASPETTLTVDLSVLLLRLLGKLERYRKENTHLETKNVSRELLENRTGDADRVGPASGSWAADAGPGK